ncbi:tRNA lysidine(34) synthetase TilS [Candidatus Babeliales bacterium]|nr:tRNA lysidine(34) synthetase TilS [Candidatus Babeliales bacterium]
MLLKKIEENIKHIINNKPKILLGLSGGPDSVFLFHFLKNLHEKEKIKLICAHLDHGWRSESAQELKFCVELCKKYKINVFTEHSKNLCLNFKFNGSKEELGRKLRRYFLEKIFKNQNADLIALAHHLQDQQETFIFRIIRGCSLDGMSCMKLINTPYFRPLLNINKQQILDYLNNKIEYLTDKTNFSDNFLRNRIRKYVLPELQKCDSRFDQKFESSIKNLQQENEFLKNLTQEIYQKTFKEKSFDKNKKSIGDLKEFLMLDQVLQKRIIIYWLVKENLKFNPSKNYFDEILKFLKSEHGGSHNLSKNWALHKKQNKFWIEK